MGTPEEVSCLMNTLDRAIDKIEALKKTNAKLLDVAVFACDVLKIEIAHRQVEDYGQLPEALKELEELIAKAERS